jgi:porin
LHFKFSKRFGTTLDPQGISNPLPVEEIYGDGEAARITYFEYEQPFAKGRFDLLIGKYNQQDDFVLGYAYWGVPKLCFFYVSENACGTDAAFSLNNGVVANGTEGFVYYPSSQWGARLRANLGSAVYVQAAVIQGNPIVNSKTGGFYFGFNGGTGVNVPVEIGLMLNDRKGNLQGTVRVGGYYDTSEVQKYATLATGSLALVPFETSAAGLASNAAAIASIRSTYVRGRSGAYVSMDHLIAGSSSPGQRGTAILVSGQYGDPQSSFASTTFDLGLVRYGTFAGRANDTIAVQFVTNDYNVRLQRLESKLQSEGYVVPNTVQNQIIELDYGVQVNS